MAFGNEVRQAVRSLGRSPTFSVLAVVTLALGIGATAAIFSVVRGVLLEPLPFPEPDRLVQLWQVGEEGGRSTWSDPNIIDIAARSRAVETIGAYSNVAYTVTGTGDPVRVQGAGVSETFFDALGVRPLRGRTLAPDDFAQGASVVVVSHALWQDNLGGDPDVVGRPIQLGAQSYDIIGVLPPRQEFPANAELWMPRPVDPELSRTAHNARLIARLAPDVGVRQAENELDGIADELKALYGADTWMSGVLVVPLHDQLTGSVRPALLVLLGAAALLMLIACANVANLLLARAAGRNREVAVRLALGAGRSHILRQLLTESGVLALAGAAVGIVMAVIGVDALLLLEPGRLPRLDRIGVDGTVLAFTLLVAGAAAIAIGLIATLRTTRVGVGDALSEGGRGGSAARRTSRLRNTLVAAQVALTLVLLVGAGLLSRSFLRLITIDPGFRTEGALVVDVTLPPPDGSSDDPLIMGTANTRGAAALDEILVGLRALPGTEAAGGINAVPLTGGGSNGMFLKLERPDEVQSLEGWRRLQDVPGRTGNADYRVATPGYFEAMGIPVIQGRTFTESDRGGPLHAAVVSASLAESAWPGEDPIGKFVQYGNMDGVLYPFRVVGVVGDVRAQGLESEPRPTFYGNAFERTPMLGGGFDVVIAGSGPAAGQVAAARRIVSEATPDGPARYRMLEEIFSASLSERRFSLILLGVFGAAALLLAVAGIYGVISYTVAQRTREIGIRVAVGADSAGVMRMVVGEALAVTAVGLGVGIAGAWAATRLLSTQLYGVGALDPVTFGSVAILLGLAAVAASYVPARQATRVDPMEALRAE